MYSYQHIYHAGNKADVHKHLALLATLSRFRRRPGESLLLCDGFAGRGLYNLTSPEAQKIQEFEEGIFPVLKSTSSLPLLQQYQKFISSLNSSAFTRYPGSAFFFTQFKRRGDRVLFYENHPQEVKALRQAFGRVPGLCIEKADVYTHLPNQITKAPRRGIILLDPSFEIKTEYEMLPTFIKKLHTQWPGGMILLWYPLLPSQHFQKMEKALKDIFPKSFFSHWLWADEAGPGMYGSGLWCLNLPSSFATLLEEAKEALKDPLALR